MPTTASSIGALNQSPRRPDQGAVSPPKSPTRRVLGELTPNARTSPAFIRHADELVKTPVARTLSSPLKRERPVTPADILSEKHRLEREEQSRKRAWDDDENAVGFDKRRRHDSWDLGRRAEETPRPAAISFDSTTTVEDSPELVIVEPKGGRERESPRPCLETTAAKGSFSSLIDYDPADASDTSDHPSASPSAASHGPEEVEPSLESKVELLRLRLRIAMYKVRTRQTTLPLSRLKVLNEFAPVAKPAREVEADVSSPELPTPSGVSNAAVKPLGLLPAPVLLPTAYSARFVQTSIDTLPSSPPSARMSPRKGSLQVAAAPSLPVTRVSSPAKAHPTPMARRVMESEENLTSSAVKGRAADGLLELMRGS